MGVGGIWATLITAVLGGPYVLEVELGVSPCKASALDCLDCLLTLATKLLKQQNRTSPAELSLHLTTKFTNSSARAGENQQAKHMLGTYESLRDAQHHMVP